MVSHLYLFSQQSHLSRPYSHQLKQGRVCSAKHENCCSGCGFSFMWGTHLTPRASVRCSLLCQERLCRSCGLYWPQLHSSSCHTPAAPRVGPSRGELSSSPCMASQRGVLLVYSPCLLTRTC